MKSEIVLGDVFNIEGESVLVCGIPGFHGDVFPFSNVIYVYRIAVYEDFWKQLICSRDAER